MKILVTAALIFSNLISGISGVYEEIQPQTSNLDKNLPIIMYHSVNDDTGGYVSDFIISTETFTSDMTYIKENGYTPVLMSDLESFVSGDMELPEKIIMITFDDGYEDNYYNAYKIMKYYNMKAMICPISKFYYDKPTGFPHITAEQTLEMQNSGLIEFASHTYDLHTNDKRYGTRIMYGESYADYKAMLTDDITKNNNFYTENDLTVPTTFSYPYGANCNESDKIIKELGYTASFVTAPAKYNKISQGDYECLYNLSRMNRPRSMSTEEFFADFLNMDFE